MKKTTILLVLLTLFLGLQANSQVTTYPYSEDFEAGDGGWVADNATAGTWALGAPTAAIINSAASGANAWVTNLSGTYNANESSTVTGPVFDLSSLVAPSISFGVWWNSEFSWDGMALQSSIDGGTTWVSVGAFGDDGNWYTDNTINGNPGGQAEGWSGRNSSNNGSGGWVTANHALTGLGGQSNVLLRFAFGSDGSVQDEGVAFDNISIFEVTCPSPTGLTATTLSDSAADITWAAGGAETTWEIIVQAAGTGTPADTDSGTATMANMPYSETALTPSTAYEAYVRATCGGANGNSIWVGPVNFTTFNTPPPPPVGVTCASGSSTILFTESFGTDPAANPIGWTGTGFDGSNGNWDITNPSANSGGTGPANTYDGNPGVHLEYEASGNSAAIASAISPAIDLSVATDGAELAFWMHAFGDDFGTLNVNVGTSVTGPFTTVYTWVGDLQTTDAEAWVPIGINLDAYLGQVIYIEFSYGGAGTGFEGDMSIDQVTVETCGNFCVAPTNIMVDNITDTTADVSWTANNGETQWEYVIQPAGTGTPTGAGTVTTTNPLLANSLTASTAYEVYILADCGGPQSVWAGPVNFTTLNTPPPPPVGVTCASGTSSTIFTETFGADPAVDPAGWTGTGFDGSNGNWDITNPAANSGGTGPANTYDGNPGTHLEYEASGNAADIASAISPAIDLSTATDGAELAFWMHAFGADIGTLNVNVGTSATGPFTTVYTWIGDYQTTDAEAWVPIGINLDAYLGQVIYLEFSYGGTGAGFEGDMSIDQITVETCGSFCIAPSNLIAANITDTTADISWTANSGETQWEYVIQPAGTGTPTGPGTVTNTPGFMATNLVGLTAYEVYVLADCGGGSQSVWAGPLNFTTDVQLNFTIDCNGGPQTINYCYENNDANVFTFTSSDGTTPLNFIVNAGTIEGAPFDFLVMNDSDGSPIYNDEGNNGDLAGLSFQSTGGSISFQITSDGSVNCQGGGFTPLDITVSCATCINPAATFEVVDDCANGNQFLVDVNITTLGDAMSLAIQDNQGNPPVSVSAIGITQFGPYPFNVDVNFTVSNEQDVNCVVTSNTFNIPTCPPANDNCLNAISVPTNTDATCTNFTSATLFGATPSSQPNACTGTADDDVWFSFVATATDHAINLSNIVGPTTFISHGVYEGPDCDNLTNLSCNTANESVVNGLTVGNTYYIRIYTFNDIPFQDVNFDLCIFTVPPPITTNTTQFTVPELVEDVLVNSPCSTISNVTWSTGTDFGSDNGIGYFEANGSGFPFESGIIMTTGNVDNAPGPETGTISDGDFNWPGDADLEAVIMEGPTNNASIIEFDFVPFIQDMSFEFIFAAEEYGTFQCGFSDAFAFLLTDTVTGVTTNIAVIPGTTTPVSVFTIRDMAFNGACPSANPALFDSFYGAGGLPALTNPTNFIGRTVPLFATSTVVPNRTYHIKLVIADDGDTAFDSAVFLKAGSFEIGEVDLGEDILLGSGNAACEGDEVILDIGVPVGDNATITWYTLNNGIQEPILDDMGMPENGTTLTVTETNNYIVEIVLNANASCFVIDDILVEFFPNPILPDALPDILGCDTDNTGVAFFDLTENDALIIGTQTGLILSYYLTQQDAMDGTNPIMTPAAYQTAPITIYYSAEDSTTGCAKVGTFNLSLAPKPILVQADNILGCDDDEDGISNYDLTSNEDVIVNNQSGFNFSYHNNLTDAETSMNAIASPSDFDGGAQTIYVRVEDATTGCFETTTFELTFGIAPMTSFDPAIIYEVCPNATVPIIVTATADNYMESDVSITWYNEGDLVPGQADLSIDNVLTAGIYTIEVMFNATGCTASEDIVVTELETCVIPQGISPDGDGLNDFFDLSSYDVQSLQIFNRNGRKVYEKTNYIDEWHGQSLDGDELPVGTYYYVMNYQGDKTKAAWVYINRAN